ncbi:ribosome biogenesis GTP-binding protein YihA/YsxC [Saprospira sp. CCB-QB6]|uniref:ribosome biogenesis GTP-binding protein YihA/YsxC n=1 Tax=Saprospira sp. CCB-QB6 TaxID=3023936 RepID=UPI00234B9348|nr:ribosome biogenesis GTP-binding protein YihA/YsxC [Saprospira sp. CCB-QB6]WCL82125.1 ribosome biogenesis GTP-binding protein YihA/YsxC [Saprospira sp. CCB-QB6]
MIIKTAEYLISVPKVELAPHSDRPEYAFIGRSNVGKSSLINMLTGHSKLALTSGRPGKTRMINYFDINKEWYLVDLPGYGYAQTGKQRRQNWRKMIEEYFLLRISMQCAFLLIDSGVPPQDIDIEFANWLGENQIPFVIVFTKTDKKKARQGDNYIRAFKQKLGEYWEQIPPCYLSSAESKRGREELLEFIESVNANFEPLH